MSTVSSKTTMPPWPTMALRGGEGLVIHRQVELRGREIGAERAADLDGADGLAGEGAAAEVLDEFAQRDAEGLLDEAALA